MLRLLFMLAAVAGCKSRREQHEPPVPQPIPAPVRADATVEIADAPAAPTPGKMTKIAFGDAEVTDLAIDSKGDIVVAVQFKGTVSIGKENYSSNEEGVVLAKLAPDFSITWSKLLAKDRTMEYARVAIDSKDAIVIAATMRDTIDLGGGALASAGEKDVVLAKFAVDGKHVWSKRFGGGSPDRPAEVVVDAKDHIVVGGYYANTADFGGKKLTGKNDAEMFVVRCAPDGKVLFANRISGGGTQRSELYSVAVDANGNVIAIGGMGEKLDLGGTPLVGVKGAMLQTYVVAYAPSGRIAWSHVYAGGGGSLMHDIAVDAKGTIVLAGTDFNVPADPNNMVSFDVASGQPAKGSMTQTLVALGADRKPLWTVAVAGAGMGDSIAIALADNGDVLVVGDGTAPFGEKMKTFAARVAAGKLQWVHAIPDAADFTASPVVATRGATIVIAAQTGKDASTAVSLMHPE